MKQNRFPSLNAALESEGLLDSWLMDYTPIGYGETRQYTWEDGTRFGHLVSITRFEDGCYERPVHYKR